MAAAAGYGILSLLQEGIDGGSFLVLILGFASSVLAGIWAIRFLRTYVETHSFKLFAIYRLILAAIILIVLR